MSEDDFQAILKDFQGLYKRSSKSCWLFALAAAVSSFCLALGVYHTMHNNPPSFAFVVGIISILVHSSVGTLSVWNLTKAVEARRNIARQICGLEKVIQEIQKGNG